MTTTLSGIIDGSGALTKAGDGILSLEGINPHDGPTTVAAGTLWVNGATLSNITVNSGAELGGTGAIGGSVTANSGSRVAPGNSIGTLWIAGDYNHAAGATLAAEVAPDGSGDRLNVAGTANIAGGVVDVQASGAASDYGLRTSYVLIAANDRSGAFDDVTVNLTDLDSYLAYADGHVYLLLQNGDIDFVDLAGGSSMTGNQVAVAQVLNNASPLSIFGDMADILSHLDGLSPEELRGALDAIGGQTVLTSLPLVGDASYGQFLRGISSRLGQVHSGGGHGAFAAAPEPVMLAYNGRNPADLGPLTLDGKPVQGLWVRGVGVLGDVDGDVNAEGFDYEIGGILVGLEGSVGDHFLLGVAGGYASTKIDYDLRDNDGEVDSRQVALYGSFVDGPFYVDTTLGFARNNYDISRRILFPGLDRTATADYRGSEYSADVEAGYTIQAGGFDIQPRLGFLWAYLDEDPFTEEGAGALNLTVDDRSTDFLRSRAGVRLAYPIETAGGGSVIPEVRGSWVHEFGDSQQSTDAYFTGTPAAGTFTVDGIDIDRDSAVLGAGLTVVLKERISLMLDYDAELRGEQNAHAVVGGLKYNW